jgi:hypothetical protein
MHPAVFLLLSVVGSAWTAVVMYLVKTQPYERFAIYRGRRLPLVVLQAALGIPALLLLLLFGPLVLILMAARSTEGIVPFIGIGVWLAAFGLLPWAYHCLSHPSYLALSAAERERCKPYLVGFSLSFPVVLLTSAAIGVSLISKLPIPELQEALAQPARQSAGLLIPFALGFLGSAACGGYAGFRLWKLFASRSLSPSLVLAISRPQSKRRALEKALRKAQSAHSGQGPQDLNGRTHR